MHLSTPDSRRPGQLLQGLLCSALKQMGHGLRSTVSWN